MKTFIFKFGQGTIEVTANSETDARSKIKVASQKQLTLVKVG